MRIAKYEFQKGIKSPFLWILFVTFLVLNAFGLHCEYGDEQVREGITSMHDTILEHGIDLRSQEVTSREVNEADDLEIAYQACIDEYEKMYDDLDMMDILAAKKELIRYQCSGSWDNWITHNYEILQRRVEHIKESGEKDYGFYPGLVYKVHGALFGTLTQKLLTETTVIMMLSILFVMDYERIQKTREQVLVTQVGKAVMQIKILVGVTLGFLFCALLMGSSYLMFFGYMPMRGLWNIPVGAALAAEQRDFLIYPLITFERLTWRENFVLTILVCVGVLLLVAGISIAAYLFLQNSYLAFLIPCVGYMFLLIALCYHTGTWFDLIKKICDPVQLWGNCGGWFMESDVMLAFRGNEAVCLVCSGTWIAFLVWRGIRRYKTLELA